MTSIQTFPFPSLSSSLEERMTPISQTVGLEAQSSGIWGLSGLERALTNSTTQEPDGAGLSTTLHHSTKFPPHREGERQLPRRRDEGSTLSPAVRDLLQQLLNVFHTFVGNLIGGTIVYPCTKKSS